MTYAVGGPTALVAGDFTGDGRTDLAVAEPTAPTSVSVLLGNGDGTFQQPVTYAVGSGPDRPRCGRLHRRRPDRPGRRQRRLRTTCRCCWATATARSSSQATYAVGSGPIALVAGDFTGDGRTDLAVADDSAPNDVSVLLGNGDGTFQHPTTYAGGVRTRPPSWRATSPATAGPTWPSPTTRSDDVSVLAGQRRRHLPAPGDATPWASIPRRIWWRATSPATAGPTWPSPTPTPTTCRSCWATATARSSRQVDLRGGDRTRPPWWRATSTATAGPTWPSPTTAPNDVSVLLGNGDGTFQTRSTYAVGIAPAAIVTGDFTGDGRTDLAVANYDSNDVSVLLGNGDGTFQPRSTYAVGVRPDALVAGDFNGDGRTDLAVANAGSERRVDPAGQRRRHVPEPGRLRGGVRARTPLVAGDFTGDGRTDLAVANDGSERRVGAAGQRRRHVPAPGTYAVGDPGPTPSWRATSPATAGPTWPSPATSLRLDDVSVLAGQRRRHVPAPGDDYAVGSAPTALVTGDFNGDGRTDLAVANGNLGTDRTRCRCCWATATARSSAGDVSPVGYDAPTPSWRATSRRRPDRPGRRQRQLPPDTTCRCSWATATARSSPR